MKGIVVSGDRIKKALKEKGIANLSRNKSEEFRQYLLEDMDEWLARNITAWRVS